MKLRAYGVTLQHVKHAIKESNLDVGGRALEMSERFKPLEIKLRQARKEGLIRSEYLGHQVEEAERAEVISKSEAAELRDYHEKVQYLLSVDDFPAEEIGRGAREVVTPASDEEPGAPTRTTKKKPAKKKASAKKTARRKTSKKKAKPKS